jgi:aryl-alcohol dehydrogenase-like predicted oxidoreductase
MMQSLEASLSRLQSDHIDVYYVHRWDPHTPIDETMRALDDLVRMGKVRYVAVSDFAAWQLAHANLFRARCTIGPAERRAKRGGRRRARS